MMGQRGEDAGVRIVAASRIVDHPQRTIVGFHKQLSRLPAHVGPDRMKVDFVVRDPIGDAAG